MKGPVSLGASEPVEAWGSFGGKHPAVEIVATWAAGQYQDLFQLRAVQLAPEELQRNRQNWGAELLPKGARQSIK